jgi:outer membrane protein TolC
MRFSISRPAVIAWFVLLLTLCWAGVGSAAEPAPAQPADPLAGIEVLDLPTAAHVALSENPTLQAAQARVEQAAQVVKQAQSAYYPQVDAVGGYSRQEMSKNQFAQQNQLYSMFGVTLDNPEDYYQAGLKATWLIFNGLAREFTVSAAKYGEKATVASRDDARRLLLLAVTATYLQGQLANENVAIAKADEAFNQRLLTEAKLRYDVGTGPLSDVLNFQVRANQALSKRIQEERVYQTNLISLAALLGLPQGRLPERIRLAELAPTTTEEKTLPQAGPLVETALSRRPDLQQSEWRVKQAEAGVTTAQSGYYPTVTLAGDYTGERTGDMGFGGDDFGNAIGVGMTWNLFAGGLTRARTGEAKALLMIAERGLDETRLNITSEINLVTTQILAAQEQLSLQETNTELVQQQRDLVEKEYKAGVGSLVRLNEAQRDLTVSLAQLALSRVGLRLLWYDLQAKTGQILDTLPTAYSPNP